MSNSSLPSSNPPYLSVTNVSGMITLICSILTIILLIITTRLMIIRLKTRKLIRVGVRVISQIGDLLSGLIYTSISSGFYAISLCLRDFSPYMAVNGGMAVLSSIMALSTNLIYVYYCKDKQRILASTSIEIIPLWPFFFFACFILLGFYIPATIFTYHGVQSLHWTLSITNYSISLWYLIVVIVEWYLNVKMLSLVEDAKNGLLASLEAKRSKVIWKLLFAFHLASENDIEKRMKHSTERSAWRFVAFCGLVDFTFLALVIIGITLPSSPQRAENEMAINFLGSNGVILHIFCAGQFSSRIKELIKGKPSNELRESAFPKTDLATAFASKARPARTE